MVDIDDLLQVQDGPNKEYRKTLVYGDDVNELVVEATSLIGKKNVAEALRRIVKAELPNVIRKARLKIKSAS